VIRGVTEDKYSMYRIRYQFETWFEMLDGLWGIGWPDLGITCVNDLDLPSKDPSFNAIQRYKISAR
jgi:hypothetical protein